jgi:hypothetical protein
MKKVKYFKLKGYIQEIKKIEKIYNQNKRNANDLTEGEYFYDSTHLKKNINFKSKQKSLSNNPKTINFQKNELGWFSDILTSTKDQTNKQESETNLEPSPVNKTPPVPAKPSLPEKENFIKGDDLLDMLDF